MKFLTIFLLAALSIFLNLIFTSAQKCPERKHIVCYWASWATYRPGKGSHKLQNIIPQYCTHFVYSFAGLNLKGEIDSLDPGYDKGAYRDFTNLRDKNPCAKFLLAIGGWNEGSAKYSLMAETVASRERFAESVIRFLIFYNFDGLDLDWEYPAQREGLPNDKENYVELLKVLKARLSPRNKILTAAIPASTYSLNLGFDIKNVCENLDFVSLMAYDMHFINMTSIQAPLKLESGENQRETIDDVIKYMENANCPLSKIVLGIPTVARTYLLKDEKMSNVGAAVIGLGTAGPYLKAPGTLGYNELCDMKKHGNGWKTEYFLNGNAAVITYRKRLWASYDNEKTIAVKGKYVLDNGLAGLMFWSIDTDDFRGECHKKSYPLLLAANNALKNVTG